MHPVRSASRQSPACTDASLSFMLDLVCFHNNWTLQKKGSQKFLRIYGSSDTFFRKAGATRGLSRIIELFLSSLAVWISNPGTLPTFPMTPETQKAVFIFQ